MSVLQTVQKKQQTIYIWTDSAKKKLHWSIYSAPDSAKKQQQQFTYGQTVQKNNKQFTYGQTVQKNNKQFTYGQTVQKNNKQFTYGQTVQKKLHWSIYSAPDSAKKTTTIYIWTVHIYRLYRRQCAKYTYIYSVHIVYYKDTLNYQRHIIHRMCHESGSHSLKLHITHGLHFPSCTALTHSRPPLHQSHSCHHSLINSDCLTTPAPHSLTHIKAAHKHSPSAKSCFPLVTFLSVLLFILLSLCFTPDCLTLDL